MLIFCEISYKTLNVKQPSIMSILEVVFIIPSRTSGVKIGEASNGLFSEM